MMSPDTPPPAQSYRVRMIARQWHIRLYADMTVGDCVGTVGPFATIEEADAHGQFLGLRDGDKGDGD